MKLKELVINKINELGISEAAKYFGKSESSIKMWQKGKVPLEAVEKIMAEDEALGISEPVKQASSPVRQASSPVKQASSPATHDSELELVWQRLAELNTRIGPVEAFLREHFPMAFDAPPGPPQPQMSMIEPIPSKVIPPAITEASLRDNKTVETRLPNAGIQQPVPVAKVPDGQLPGPWVPDPRAWSRPHNFNRR